MGTTYPGALQYGREIGLLSKYNKKRWEFIAKEQGEGTPWDGWKIPKRAG